MMAQVNWTITNSAGNTVLIVYQTVGDSGPYFFYANPDYLEADGFDKTEASRTKLGLAQYL